MNAADPQTKRPHPARGGFTLIEIAIAGTLLSAAAGLAIALMLRLSTVAEQRATFQAEAQTVVEVRRVLRRDLAAATAIGPTDGGLELTIDSQPVLLHADEAVTRTVDGYTQTLPTPRGTSTLQRVGDVVVWTWTPPAGDRAGSTMIANGAAVPWQVVVAVPEAIR